VTEPAHAPVLASEVIDSLALRDHGVYVDGTLGRGGHTALILERCPGAQVIGVDRDPEAIAACRERFGARVELVHGTYDQIGEVLAGRRVDGILLDLGVSSPQLDVGARGFSFAKPGPLDMRMDPTTGSTALELMTELEEDELADVIFELGEERFSRKIARGIKDAIAAGKLATTTELAAVCMKAIPAFEQRKSKIHPATRTFQALRIAVNGELEQLDRFLAGFVGWLAVGGRCAIISFHSLEDRRVKTRFRDLAWTSSLPPALAARAGERSDAVCELVTRKAIVAGDDELARNPRSRSARLRVCERTAAAEAPSGAPPDPRER
jgi:16S rRNA (cytosine1402-N4)-methyltransferase